jgi:hypothetical protein
MITLQADNPRRYFLLAQSIYPYFSFLILISIYNNYKNYSPKRKKEKISS